MPKLKSSTSQPATTPPTAKVFIVEDHPVFRQGLVKMVNAEGDLTVCGEAGDAESALPAIRGTRPDVVLVDITLPGRSGLQLIKDLRGMKPKPKLLVVSMHDEALYANRVLRAGGDGYIMKQEDPEEILHAIRDILQGRIYVSEAVMASKPRTPARAEVGQPKPRLEALSDTELEALELLGRGKSPREIARELSLSAKQVGAQCTQMRKKLGFKSANQLIRYAVCWVEASKP
jgi:DNA-binding NarL/FixJ family response regulator